MRKFTREELKKYDGKDGRPAYIAYKGKVYDVTSSFLWQKGKHMAMHYAGEDLTAELEQAPHGEDLLERFPVIGKLAD